MTERNWALSACPNSLCLKSVTKVSLNRSTYCHAQCETEIIQVMMREKKNGPNAATCRTSVRQQPIAIYSILSLKVSMVKNSAYSWSVCLIFSRALSIRKELCCSNFCALISQNDQLPLIAKGQHCIVMLISYANKRCPAHMEWNQLCSRSVKQSTILSRSHQEFEDLLCTSIKI